VIVAGLNCGVAATVAVGSRRVVAGRPHPRRCAKAALLIGYARCSTDQQDLTAQRDGLTRLGVAPRRIYVDHA
jgi:hypothetical protein